MIAIPEWNNDVRSMPENKEILVQWDMDGVEYHAVRSGDTLVVSFISENINSRLMIYNLNNFYDRVGLLLWKNLKLTFLTSSEEVMSNTLKMLKKDTNWMIKIAEKYDL